MTQKFLTLILLLVAVFASALFTWLNPGRVELDLGFMAVSAPIAVAIVAAFAGGWLFGVLCSMPWVARIARDRRRLARSAERTERPAGTSLTIRDGSS